MAHTRPAQPRDAAAIAAIYNHGIDERVATFETRHRSAEEVREWLRQSQRVPVIVAERAGAVAAFARVLGYSDREAYSGVGELQAYVHPDHRHAGLGRQITRALAEEAGRRGYWKLLALVFTTNEPMLALLKASGYREVGVHERHGQLDGDWRDVFVLELRLGAG